MSTYTEPNLDEVAQRNPAVSAKRVRELQALMDSLRERGLLRQSEYDIQPPLERSRKTIEVPQRMPLANRAQRLEGSDE